MNYLTELLSFYRFMEAHPLSPLLQAYWHLLMYYNNKAAVQAVDGLWYWPVSFNVPNTILMARLGLKNRQALWTQRQTLIRAERLTYVPGIGSRAGVYSLIPFDQGLAAFRLCPRTAKARPGSGHKPEPQPDQALNHT
ncbi:hypothetical protein [Eubacterium callanderi]|uniref:hypothetical protein n=1 Tax=Eubacterium callanderi TaxID=53442 RepID=UPI00325FB4D0